MGRGLQTKKNYCYECRKHVVDAAVTRVFLHDVDLGGCGHKVLELTTQNRLRLAIDSLLSVEKFANKNSDAHGQATYALNIIGRRP